MPSLRARFCRWREPGDTPDRACEDYDGSLKWCFALAPAVWLAIVGACLLFAFHAVGYLTVKESDTAFSDILASIPDSAQDLPARRAAMAYSGVTTAITIALSFTSLVWAIAIFLGKAARFKWPMLGCVSLVFLGSLGVLGLMRLMGFESFTSSFGYALLNGKYSGLPDGTRVVPNIMFALACLVPAILAAGASLLLQPIVLIEADNRATTRQLGFLVRRLTELDQLLYIGALALVFGTLQLSAALSIPLESMPKSADLKIQIELCKTLATTPASSPFFTQGTRSAPGETADPGGLGLTRCRALPKEIARSQTADSLRQLIRGVTLALGLAYSALLAAIYIPALIGLRLMIEPRQKALGAAAKEDGTDKSLGDIDPIRRIAAFLATFSPLIAGLVANAVATS